MENFVNNISGYVKNLVQIRENKGTIFLINNESEVSFILNTKDFIEAYFESIITDIGVFQNLSKNKITEKIQTYVEPTLKVGETLYLRKEITQNISNDLLIVGAPGSGKSLFINKIVIECLEETLNYFPIYIRLSEYEYLSKELLSLIYLKFTNENTNSENIFNAIYKEKEILICLDGFDEIQSKNKRKHLGSEILYLKKQFPNIKFIITSRPLERYYFKIPLQQIQIEDFNEEKIDELIHLKTKSKGLSKEVLDLTSQIKSTLIFKTENYDFEENNFFWSKKSVDKAIEHGIYAHHFNPEKLIISNPLLLSFIIEIIIKDGVLPYSISDIYSMYFIVNLDNWNEERKENIEDELGFNFPSSEWADLCYWIAFSLFDKEQLSIHEGELWNLIKEYFVDKGYPITLNYKKFIDVLSDDFGFIKKSKQKLYRFFHTSVTEYCCAQYLLKNTAYKISPLEYFFLRKKKEVIYYYYQGLSLDNEILFLSAGIQFANSFISNEIQILNFFKEIEVSFNSITNSKDKVFLFFFHLSAKLLVDVSKALTTLSITILERLLNNFYNIDVFDDANYIYLGFVSRYSLIAKSLNHDSAIKIAKELNLKYPTGKIDNNDLTTFFGVNSTENLCSYFYIIERLLFMNENQLSPIDFWHFFSAEEEQSSKNLFDLNIDFFDHNEMYRYALLEKDFEIAQNIIIKTLEDVHIHPDAYINASTFYENFGISGKCISLEILQDAINDVNNNSVYKNYRIDWVVADNKEGFINVLYSLLASITVDLLSEVIHDTDNNEVYLEKSFNAFSIIPKDKLTYPNKSWFAYLLKFFAQKEDSIKKMEYEKYSLLLYLESIFTDNDYIIGYLQAIELNLSLSNYDNGKKLLLKVKNKINQLENSIEKEIITKIKELEFLYEKY